MQFVRAYKVFPLTLKLFQTIQTASLSQIPPPTVCPPSIINPRFQGSFAYQQTAKIRLQNDCISFETVFILSGYFYSASSSPLLLRGVPDCSIDTVSEPHAEALQATASEGLAQGPYVAASIAFEPATLRMQDAEHTTEPSRPTIIGNLYYSYNKMWKCFFNILYLAPAPALASAPDLKQILGGKPKYWAAKGGKK